MAAELRKGHRDGERGQVLVLFVLIFVTLVVIGLLAVNLGQMLVRRHQAQMIVDAAAFAGASRQAEGLNTIANLNKFSLQFLQAIQRENVFVPYIDSQSTTTVRLAASALGAFTAGGDWAGDTLEGYQDIFDVFDNGIKAANCLYSDSSLVWHAPRKAASQVVNDNFGNASDQIFRSVDLDGHGIVDSTRIVNKQLVKLSDRQKYEIGTYYYLPNPGHTVASQYPFGAAYAYGTYVFMDVVVVFPYRKWIDPIDYELGRFYENPQGEEVRFAYYLKVSGAPTIFGRTFFENLPPIIVAAAAKPYGGYLGDKYLESSILGHKWTKSFPYPIDDLAMWILGSMWDENPSKTISTTYRAKLVPLNARERAALEKDHSTSEDPERWWTISH